MAGGNRRSRAKWGVLAAVLVVAAGMWLLYPRETDRQQIEALIRRGKHGIETKNVKEIMGCIADDYRDPENVSRSDLFKMVIQWPRLDYQGQVTIEDYRMEVEGDTATGSFDVAFVLAGQGRSTSYPMRLTMKFGKYRRGLRRVWLIKSVEGYDTGTLIEGVGNGE